MIKVKSLEVYTKLSVATTSKVRSSARHGKFCGSARENFNKTLVEIDIDIDIGTMPQ